MEDDNINIEDLLKHANGGGPTPEDLKKVFDTLNEMSSEAREQMKKALHDAAGKKVHPDSQVPAALMVRIMVFAALQAKLGSEGMLERIISLTGEIGAQLMSDKMILLGDEVPDQMLGKAILDLSAMEGCGGLLHWLDCIVHSPPCPDCGHDGPGKQPSFDKSFACICAYDHTREEGGKWVDEVSSCGLDMDALRAAYAKVWEENGDD